jgi:hypothetical protein
MGYTRVTRVGSAVSRLYTGSSERRKGVRGARSGRRRAVHRCAAIVAIALGVTSIAAAAASTAPPRRAQISISKWTSTDVATFLRGCDPTNVQLTCACDLTALDARIAFADFLSIADAYHGSGIPPRLLRLVAKCYPPGPTPALTEPATGQVLTNCGSGVFSTSCVFAGAVLATWFPPYRTVDGTAGITSSDGRRYEESCSLAPIAPGKLAGCSAGTGYGSPPFGAGAYVAFPTSILAQVRKEQCARVPGPTAYWCSSSYSTPSGEAASAAVAFGFPLRCVQVTFAPSDRSYARVELNTAKPCVQLDAESHGGFAILQDQNGVWGLPDVVPAAVRAELDKPGPPSAGQARGAAVWAADRGDPAGTPEVFCSYAVSGGVFGGPSLSCPLAENVFRAVVVAYRETSELPSHVSSVNPADGKMYAFTCYVDNIPNLICGDASTGALVEIAADEIG